MRRKKIAMVALTLLCCVLMVFPAFATKSSLDSAKQKKNALAQEKKRAEQTLKKLEALKGDAVRYVAELDESLEELSDELSKLAETIETKEEQIEKTKTELQDAEAVEADQYESMKLRIKYMYEKGDSTYVDLLMAAKSLSELLNKAEYIGKISEYDRQKLDEYAATKAMIADANATLEREHAELLELQEQTEAKHASVEELLAAKQLELKSVENKIATAEAEVSAHPSRDNNVSLSIFKI